MKNLAKYFTGIVFVANLAACAYQEPVCDQPYVERDYGQTSATTINNTAAYQTGSNCQPSEYTVRTPVEVVYKNTTYRTVYVPQTSQSVSYEKRPYTAGDLWGNGECAYQ